MTGKYAKGIVAAMSALLVVGNTALGPQFDGQLSSRTSGWITLAVSVIGALLVYLVPNSHEPDGSVMTPAEVAKATLSPMIDRVEVVANAFLAKLEPQVVTVTKDPEPVDVDSLSESVLSTLGPLVKAALARAIGSDRTPTTAPATAAPVAGATTGTTAAGATVASTAQRVTPVVTSPVGAVVPQERG